MDRTERFYRIQELLNQRRVVPRSMFLDDLGVSLATFKRDLEYLRDRMAMPIVWDRLLGGYRLDKNDPHARTFELPGLWFSAEEIYALLVMEQMLERLQPGLLSQQVRPLRERIRKILDSGDHAQGEVSRRIRILQMGARSLEPKRFQAIASALLSRRRLVIRHFGRGRGKSMARTVSPQRLVYYRDNWYLDAWCHSRKALRTFSVDAISEAAVDNKRSREISETTLDKHFAPGFGIFAGHQVNDAVLKFKAERARWVSREIWHPRQSGDFELDGAYVLTVPYSDERELVMDILKYGGDVEVLAPQSLRNSVRKALKEAVSVYEKD